MVNKNQVNLASRSNFMRALKMKTFGYYGLRKDFLFCNTYRMHQLKGLGSFKIRNAIHLQFFQTFLTIESSLRCQDIDVTYKDVGGSNDTNGISHYQKERHRVHNGQS